ncbi:trypsin-like serine peptidase [Saccharopolyspora sp. CA-218241]|uniref:trypsin-like serine peptidase n=1 Tax=Saccharopolyspora sp. CA-218241 TaxID=3240027 RepID=UPI003D95737C
MMSTTVKGLVVGAAALAVGTLTAAPAAAEPVAEHRLATTAEEQRAVQDYWTPERIAALTEPASDNPPKAGPDGAPWTNRNALNATVGRLFFTDHGEDASCTATVVEAANRSTIVTAGHCVNATNLLGEDNQWTRNVLFIPAYHDGQEPFGRFTGRISFVDATWLDNDQQHGEIYGAYDQATVVLNPNERGQRVQDAVGAAQRIGFDKPGAGTATAFGYPRAASDPEREGLPEYIGERLAFCRGPAKEYLGTPDNPAAPDLWGVACIMGGGSSGGPRFAELSEETGIGTVVGTNTRSAHFDSAGDPCPTGEQEGCTRYLVGPQFTEEITLPLHQAAQQAW